MLPLIAGIVFLGVYPKPVLDRINPSVNHLLAHVQHVDPSLHIPAKGLGPVVAVGPNDDVDGPLPATTAAARSGTGTAARPPTQSAAGVTSEAESAAGGSSGSGASVVRADGGKG